LTVFSIRHRAQCDCGWSLLCHGTAEKMGV